MTLVNSGDQRSLVIMFCKIAKSVWPGDVMSWTDNSHLENISLTISSSALQYIKNKYFYTLIMQDYKGSPGVYQLYSNGDIQCHIKNYGYSLKTINKTDTVSSSILSNLTNDINAINGLSGVSISNLKIGLKLFDITTNKEYIYNGSRWVDATGATV
jgi:hypothetical protein